ncbi:hypothetical protein CSC23_3923 [Escherichia coli]|nr:hypothetical protein CSC11_3917 [Escherichia coli]AVN11301.1 hypothetical protein CSC11_2403 [Escherichia coli]AWF16522.1 hypothetical protein CSC23_3923 [Escherichia coli]
MFFGLSQKLNAGCQFFVLTILHNAWHSGSQTWRGFWYKRRDRFANPLLPLVNPFARFGNYNLC